MPEVLKQSHFLRGDREHKQRFKHVRARSEQAPAAYLTFGQKEAVTGIRRKDLNIEKDFDKERRLRG